MGFDLDAPFGEDLKFGVGFGDVQAVTSNVADFNFVVAREELIQRVVRRLLTTKGEWIPFPDYGASLHLYINEVMSSQVIEEIEAEILSQLFQEPDIARAPKPQVRITSQPENSKLFVHVFFYSADGQPVNVTLGI